MSDALSTPATVTPEAPFGKENDWKAGYSVGFEAAKTMFAPEHWAEAFANNQRLEWMGKQIGMSIQASIDEPGTILLIDATGQIVGKGTSLVLAIDDARAHENIEGV